MPATPVARKKSPGTPPPAAFPRKNSPSSGPSSVICAKKLAQHAIKRQFLAFLSTLGELFRARVRTSPSRANFFAHRTQPRADFETNNTATTTDMGQRETTITTARPSTATIETGITSAPKKRSKNAHSSPAKAMAVSTRRTYERAKATPVSGERAAWSTGPRCNTRGRRWGLAGRPVGGRRYKRRQTNTI